MFIANPSLDMMFSNDYTNSRKRANPRYTFFAIEIV